MSRVLDTRDLRCPASGKTAYLTEEKCLAVIAHAHSSASWEDRHGGLPIRAYLCDDCGWWHMTKRPLRDGRAGASGGNTSDGRVPSTSDVGARAGDGQSPPRPPASQRL